MQENINSKDKNEFCFEASNSQKRLWYIDQLNVPKNLYSEPFAYKIQGNLDKEALKEALFKIVQRHESLRTVFRVQEGKLMQVIKSTGELLFNYYDLSKSNSNNRSYVYKKIDEIIKAPFELNNGPLVKFYLLKLDSNNYIFILNLHHIITDGWSMAVFFSELEKIYKNLITKETIELTEMQFQYVDFTFSQNEWINSGELEDQLDYWKSKLGTDIEPLYLPRTDLNEEMEDFQYYQGEKVRFIVPEELLLRLKAFCKQNSTTLYMVLLTAYKALLNKYTGKNDISIGTPIANRNDQNLKNIIGFFANTLVIRNNIDPKTSFLNMLKEVSNSCIDAYENQDIPFDMVVKKINPDRGNSNNPFFNTMFVLQNLPELTPKFKNVKVTPMNLDSGVSKYDFTLTFFEDQDLLKGEIEYKKNLYDREIINRFSSHYIQLINNILDTPYKPLSQVDILSDNEKKKILEKTQVNNNIDYCCHQVFEESVQKYPLKIAITDGNQTLTYAELNERANKLANYLVKQGVMEGDFVGLSVGRTNTIIISILAILKAGGTYVPLDPELPNERLNFLCDDTNLTHIITEDSHIRKFNNNRIRIVNLDLQKKDIDKESGDNLNKKISKDRLAYIIYTSGSTGVPKGVRVSHANVTRLFSSTENWFKFSDQDVWTLFHSYSFDFSVWEIWGALFYGGKLVIVPYITSRSPQEFRSLLKKEKVTVLNQTPSAFRQLLNSDLINNDKLPLRYIIFGGEALDYNLLEKWYKKYEEKDIQLVNMYGITETTVHVTYKVISKQDLSKKRSLIGEPIPDLKVYILDEFLNPVPEGVIGEMYIGGAGVTQGYHKRLDLTTERFINDLFNEQQDERLYKTGDLARYTEDNELEYIGRIDQQVKLHGYRIELGEIKEAANEFHAIQDNEVIVKEHNGTKFIACYYIALPSFDIKRFKEHLKAKLPKYMIPSEIIELDFFPLTSNGKLDINALKKLKATPEGLKEEFEEPRNTIEKSLCSIFSSVLANKKVGISDNYFDIGGDSIRSIQIVSHANEKGFNFSIKDLIEQKTIKNLYENILKENKDIGIKNKLTKSPRFGLISENDKVLLSNSIEDAYPLTMLQEGMLFHTNYSEHNNIYHNVTLFKVKSKLQMEFLESSINYAIKTHPVLRTSFNFKDYSEPLQIVHKHVNAPIKLIDLTHKTKEEQEKKVEEWFKLEEVSTFNIYEAPLIRFSVISISPNEFYFVVTEHHAILDGWSAASLISEIFTNYHSYMNNKEIKGLDLKTDFKEYVKWEKETINSLSDKTYWTKNLESSSPSIVQGFSTDKNLTNIKNVQTHKIPNETLKNLIQLAKTESVPLKSILLAAHIKVIQLLSGSSEVTTGLVANTRLETQDAEKVLGLFLNTLPFSIDITNFSWTELIQKVFSLEKEIYEYRYYPLAQIQRDNKDFSLLNTSFNYTNFHVYESLNQLKDFEIIEIKETTNTNFPLDVDFSLSSTQDELRLILEWDNSVYSEQQISSMYNYYLLVLEKIYAETQNKHSNEILTSSELKFLEKWTDNDFTQNFIPVSEILERVVEKHPDKIAIIHNGKSLTYYTLNEKANKLARYLQNRGVKSNSIIGILLEKSINSVVSVFAVLKLGGSFLPLDTSYPEKRIKFMIKDANLSNIITDNSFDISTLGIDSKSILNIDKVKKDINYQSGRNLNLKNDINSLAYIIYTSGSTGNPKGTMVTNKNWVNTLHGYIKIFNFNEGFNHLQMSSFSFDVFCGDFIRSLCTGGTLVLYDKNKLLDARELYIAIKKYDVNFAEFVPTVFRNFFQFIKRENLELPNLKYIVLSSDTWYKDEYISFKKTLHPNNKLINMYGLTEDTIDCTAYDPEENIDYLNSHNTEIIPVGKPFINKKIYILDENLNRVPIGAPGEIYIGGNGVSKGYLNNADLTAERFVPNPYCSSKTKMYKTGDIGFYLPDGNVCLVGRSDHQVKIRGLRIELREIEKHINGHSNVQESLVLAKKEKNDEISLYAYIVKNGLDEISLESIQRELKSKLPYYMVPNEFAILDSIPQLPNGKINRKKLLEIPTKRIIEEKEYIPPKNSVEKTLAEIWGRIFKVNKVGREDNFFELGGHSLLALRMNIEISDVFGITLPINKIFEEKVLKNISNIIENKLVNQKFTNSKITKVSRDKRYSLSSAQERIWFIEQYYEGTSTHNIPLILKLKGNLDIKNLEKSVNFLVNRHEALRTQYIDIDGQPVQTVQNKIANIKIPITDIRVGEHQETNYVDSLIKHEYEKPFDLSKDLLFRAKVYKTAKDTYLLMFVFHHISFDGWSGEIFVRELSAVYNSFCNNEQVDLPEIPFQFLDYSNWQRNYLETEEIQCQVEFWKKELNNLPKMTSLILDTKRSSNIEGNIITFKIPSQDSNNLRIFSKQSEVSLYMTLLSLFKVLISINNNSNDIVIGTPIANRNTSGIDNTIGCFLNTVVLRSKIENDPTFKDFLNTVSKNTLKAFNNQDVPFEKLVSILNPIRVPNKNPLFQLFFVLHSTNENVKLQGLETREIGIENREVKFDIHMDLEEKENGILGSITYNKTLFNQETIERLIRQYLNLIKLILENKSINLNELSEKIKEMNFVKNS